MRKIYFLFLLFTCIFLGLKAQEIIENPEKPKNPNSGRILNLAEEFQIKSSGESFYFKKPYNLITSHNGFIFVADEKQLLKFSPEGEYLKNMFKSGQGPGEIAGSFRFVLTNDRLYINDYIGRKVIATDLDGIYIDEVSFRQHHFTSFFGLLDDNLIFAKPSMPDPETMNGHLRDLNMEIVLISKQGEMIKQSPKFPSKWFFTQNIGIAWDPFHAVISDDHQYLYINHRREYLITVLDVGRGSVSFSFNRKYPRIKIKDPSKTIKSIRGAKMPEQKYESDISEMFFVDKCLWVKTSTQDNQKGHLYDIFDQKGEYIDCLFIESHIQPLIIYRDCLFSLEKDEDESFKIIKYRIIS